MVQNKRTINFQEFIVFVEIANTGGITAAADRLNLAKSAVSNHLSKLESRLGVKLLERTSRQVKLTQEGSRLLPRIQSLLAEGTRLLDEAQEDASQPSGLVRLAMTPDFGAEVLREFVPKVQQVYPDIQIVAKMGYQFEDMQDPSFDIAIRVGQVNDDRLVAIPMGSFKRVLVASPAFLQQQPIETVEQLQQSKKLLFSNHSAQSVWRLLPDKPLFVNVSAPEQTLAIDAHGHIAVQSFSVLMQLACQGLGLALLPDFVVKHCLADGSLERCLPEWCSAKRDVFLAYRFGVDRIGRIKTVLELAREQVPKLLNH